jgi:hypothetical protein
MPRASIAPIFPELAARRIFVMNSIRSHKATYFAAFLLGVLIALLIARPARSAERVLAAAGAIGSDAFAEK